MIVPLFYNKRFDFGNFSFEVIEFLMNPREHHLLFPHLSLGFLLNLFFMSEARHNDSVSYKKRHKQSGNQKNQGTKNQRNIRTEKKRPPTPHTFEFISQIPYAPPKNHHGNAADTGVDDRCPT